MTATALLAGLARTDDTTRMLRRFLALDAVVTGGNGLVYAAASGPVGRLLGVDSGLLLGLGVFLVAFGIGVGLIGSRPEPAPGAVKAVIDANIVWAVVSLLSVALWFDPTTAGAVWIPVQAVTVAGFAALQWTALRSGAAHR
ncbi:hypothetical protein [Streptomyces qinzhouensis]|uniref:Integral membrane protein n=1 Tax=Streptomyces qinzhouensis TaxID=2599401 RepID=A0A5B8IMK1_9ACTN|nr:hypothetical protein [Streptomyces qinzhouensis]QDY79848.1 hypothetical protein FQU76_28635 [Streptomyces qinzhouensis]